MTLALPFLPRRLSLLSIFTSSSLLSRACCASQTINADAYCRCDFQPCAMQIFT